MFLQVLKKSCEGSSMKALPRMVRAGTAFQRSLWVLALLGGLGAVCYQLARLFMGYFQYSTSVNIGEVEGTPPFPDVTVCHMDPAWTFAQLQTALDGEHSFHHYSQRVRGLKERYEPGSFEYSTLESLDSIPGYLQNVHLIHDEGRRLQELMVTDCAVNIEWDKTHCPRGDNGTVRTRTFLDPVFGMCVNMRVPEATKALQLVLYLDEPQMLEAQPFNLLSDEGQLTTGARVVIHPRDSFPDIYLASHTVQAGTQVSFNIEGTKRSVLGEPYGSCVTPEDAQSAKHLPGFSMNRHGYECYRMCAKDFILQNCDCHFIDYATTLEDRETLTMCGDLDNGNVSAVMSRMRCANDVFTMLSDAKVMYEKCICPTPCQQFVYEYSTAELTWPHETYYLSFYEQYIQNSEFAHKFHIFKDLLTLSVTDKAGAQERVAKTDLIRRNFAEMKILNHQRTFFHYAESPLVSIEGLFGNLGGILNLWAGITFITVIEIVEFLHQLATTKKKAAHQQEDDILRKTGPADL